MPHFITSKCKSCDAEIVWAVTRNNKNISVDYNLELRQEFIDAKKKAARVLFDAKRMRTHFETCPSASKNRKNKVENGQTGTST